MRKTNRLVASEAERHELAELARSGRRLESDRARAVLWRLDGEEREHIARLLGTSKEQVSRWCSTYRREGVKGLRDKPRPGRTAVKAPLAVDLVKQILAEPNPRHTVWTVPRLAEEVARRGGVVISVSWLNTVMRKRGVSTGNARATRSRAGRIWMLSNGRD